MQRLWIKSTFFPKLKGHRRHLRHTHQTLWTSFTLAGLVAAFSFAGATSPMQAGLIDTFWSTAARAANELKVSIMDIFAPERQQSTTASPSAGATPKRVSLWPKPLPCAGTDDELQFVSADVGATDTETAFIDRTAEYINYIVVEVASGSSDQDIQQSANAADARTRQIRENYPDLVNVLLTKTKAQTHGSYFPGFGRTFSPVLKNRERVYRITLGISDGQWRLRVLSP